MLQDTDLIINYLDNVVCELPNKGRNGVVAGVAVRNRCSSLNSCLLENMHSRFTNLAFGKP